MKAQISIFDIGVLAIALVIFVILSILIWEGFHIYTKTVVINVIYDTNEAYRFLVSLLSLNYTSTTIYEEISTLKYKDEEDNNFIIFLNESFYNYFDKIPKCYRLATDSITILDFKREDYINECVNTRFSAVVPVFVPYNKMKLIEYLYLNYER